MLAANQLTLRDIDLLIEHQANFAMLPLTLEQVLADEKPQSARTSPGSWLRRWSSTSMSGATARWSACSGLPYDLARGASNPIPSRAFPSTATCSSFGMPASSSTIPSAPA